MSLRTFFTAGCFSWIALMAAGCMVPAYRLPHGFSSSYHRHIYGMEPVVIGGIPEDQLPLEPAPGVFFPESIELRRSTAAPQAGDQAQASTASPRAQRLMLPPPSTQKATPRR